LKSRPGEIRIEKMRYEILELQKINLGDERFRTSHFFNLDSLVRSIRKIGLVSPPLVRPDKTRFVLVCGWKRVLACREIGFRSIPVLVIEGHDDLRLFLLALHENLASRVLHLAEKAEILKKLQGFGLAERTIRKEYMPLLSLPATVEHLQLMWSLSCAAEAVKEFAEIKDIPIAVLQTLLKFRASEQRRLLPVLWPLGQNKQKELLEDLWDICRRDDLTVRQILQRKEPREALSSARRSSPLQAAERIRRYLRRIRFPRLLATQEAFRTALSKGRWPEAIAIQPSPFHEGGDLSISFRFRNEEEFRARLISLEELMRDRRLDAIFKSRG
jgi:ParB family chromosome partitioning protein